MEIALLIILLVFLSAGFWFIYSALKSRSEEKPSVDPALVMLQNQMNEIARTLDVKLSESTRAIQQQFGQSARIVRDVTEKLVRLEETNKQVMSFSEQLKNLQDILKNPKQRGILGEYYLETVLKNV